MMIGSLEPEKQGSAIILSLDGETEEAGALESF